MVSGRILLVDDDQLICLSLGKGLERKGYSVTTAENGNEAIGILEKERFDVVVADLSMAGEGGLGVLRRSKELHPGTSVIILTAFADLSSAVEALRIGADDYLSKPCNATDLSSHIERCVEKRHSFRALNEALATKDLELRETHHRVKNDFLMLSALVGLQLSTVDEKRDRLLFEELRTRIQTISLVHEELFHGESHEHIAASRYISELCRRTAHGFNPNGVLVSLDVNTEDEEIDANTAIPVGLIINELVTNCMRHAFEAGAHGHISVSFNRSGREYRLVVEDDGRGFANNDAIEAGDTLGMKIVVALTSQLRGTLHSQTEHGARFSVSFPVDRSTG